MPVSARSVWRVKQGGSFLNEEKPHAFELGERSKARYHSTVEKI
jgi:hypothetical protein